MGYSIEKNTQILLSLMKKHGIRKVILNPGTTNMSVAISVQQDDYFELYSCVDERSAAYMACGMAEECGEPVAISCTGATASRNYFPALTEAYYKNLPVVTITSTKDRRMVGNNFSQVIDRSVQPIDTNRCSVYIPIAKTADDIWECNLKINKAFLELKKGESGPVHINLATEVSSNFSIEKLSDERCIRIVSPFDDFPDLKRRKIGIFIGNHKKWSDDLCKNVEKFCELYDAVVIHDLTAKYYGNYGCCVNLIAEQDYYQSSLLDIDLCIYMGTVSGMDDIVKPKEVWQISADGEVKDLFRMKTTYLFNMREVDFFEKYNQKFDRKDNSNYYKLWQEEYNDLMKKIPELPFSTGWIAQNIIERIPSNSVAYFGIYNCLRNFNYFGGLVRHKIEFYSNTGGFGIDGGCSTLIGGAIVRQDILHFGFVGDLGFFYDMNSLGNKHISNNIRFMIINNGTGMEMELYSSGVKISNSDYGYFCSGKGHFGARSRNVVKHFVEDLGFEYIAADTKETFLGAVEYFTKSELTKKPIVFEIFTDPENENLSLKSIRNLKCDKKNQVKNRIKDMLSDKQRQVIKNVVHFGSSH